MRIDEEARRVAKIIRDAGGMVVGRTRLQKMAYLLEVSDLGDGFSFDYHYYGPYSEDLFKATIAAEVSSLISEDVKETKWGGSYSIYKVKDEIEASDDSLRRKVLEIANSASSIALELAATALFFAKNGSPNPWTETEERKPDKAGEGRLDDAKELYRKLRTVVSGLPHIN